MRYQPTSAGMFTQWVQDTNSSPLPFFYTLLFRGRLFCNWGWVGRWGWGGEGIEVLGGMETLASVICGYS